MYELGFRDMCVKNCANEVGRAVQWRRMGDDPYTYLNGLVHFRF